MTKLDMLNAQRAKKFTALCALVARDLGYGELPDLSEADRNHIEAEAKHYVERWGETVEMKTSLAIRPMTPLGVSWLSTSTPAKESSMSEKSRLVSGPTRNDRRDQGGGRRPSRNGKIKRSP
jgi:hypothetical protein